MSLARTHASLVVLTTGLLSSCGGGTTATGTVEPSAPDSAPLHETATAQSTPEKPTGDTTALTYTVIDAPNGTYGYDIHHSGKLLIHQTNLPGQPGVEGCRSKADAEKLAAFVVEKIKKGEMPPTVTADELRALHILH